MEIGRKVFVFSPRFGEELLMSLYEWLALLIAFLALIVQASGVWKLGRHKRDQNSSSGKVD